jgi:hypothetical protein
LDKDDDKGKSDKNLHPLSFLISLALTLPLSIPN